jgi:hypothetical protein
MHRQIRSDNTVQTLKSTVPYLQMRSESRQFLSNPQYYTPKEGASTSNFCALRDALELVYLPGAYSAVRYSRMAAE